MEHRLLYTASTFSHIVNFHLPYIQEFRRMGWQVDIACGGTPMGVPEASRTLHIPFEKSMTSPRNLKAVRMLRQIFREESYAAVLCHTALAAFFTRMALRGLASRPAVICVVHGYLFDDETPAFKRTLLTSAERLAAPVTDLLLTMNRWDLEFAQTCRLGKRVVPIPGMGVDFTRFQPADAEAGAALRAEWGFDQDDFLLVYGAEFSARKSQEVLLKALTRLPEQVGLLLPGDGALRTSCMELAARLGLEKRVAFPGQVSNMPVWYAAADGAISASRSEGLPFNIMEAMCRGLPIVASAVKGHTDLIEDGVSGLLYPYGDAEACAEKIHTLLTDDSFSKHLGAAAARAAAAYALPVVLPQVMDVYASAIPEIASPHLV